MLKDFLVIAYEMTEIGSSEFLMRKNFKVSAVDSFKKVYIRNVHGGHQW